MTEPDIIRVFVNGTGYSLARDAKVLDAVRAHDPVAADAVTAGTRAVTDSRGLPLSANTALNGGAVLRIVPVRASGAPEENT